MDNSDDDRDDYNSREGEAEAEMREEINILDAFVDRIRAIHLSGDVGLNLEDALDLLDKARAAIGNVAPPRYYALHPKCTVVTSSETWRCGHCDACFEAKERA